MVNETDQHQILAAAEAPHPSEDADPLFLLADALCLHGDDHHHHADPG